MSAKLTLEQIRRYWTSQAVEHRQSPAASWSDQMVIDLEIREILQHLADGDRVLDVGCANGYSTVQFAAQKQVDIHGVDYIPEMIEQARARLTDLTYLRGKIQFDVGDITSLAEPAASYDKVIVIRVLINLADWATQLKGLQECVRILKPGGVLLLSEATVQGWQNLNAFRHEWGLPDIPMPSFNCYVDEDTLVNAAPDLRLLKALNFASTYYVGTRVLKPLLIQALGAEIDVADPNMHWNRWFAQLPSGGNYGTQKLFVFQKTPS
jgi:ubiquinone/menaquinone biosynthesis C-methylase UbiE